MEENPKIPELDNVFKNSALVQMKAAQQSTEDLGMSQKFDRNLYDNVSKRKQFKNDFFDGRKTAEDYITGNTLHANQDAAKAKYGERQYTKHTADVDHIIPEKKAFDRLKLNSYLSDKDANEIINSKSNYRVTPSRLNRQKSDSHNIEVAFDPKSEVDLTSRAKLIGDQAKAEVSMAAHATARTVNNVANEFAGGAINSLEASAIPIMVEGVHNLYLVAKGEKDFHEAAKEMGKLTTSIAVTGGGIQVVTTGINNALRTSSSAALKNLANSNQVAQIISISLIVKDSVVKYVNGEIDGEQFFREIGEKGVGIVSGTIGAMIGQALIPIPVVGAFIGSMVISTACMELYRAFRSLDEHKEKLARVTSIAAQALAEMERQRNVLKEMITEQFKHWDQQINLGFDELYQATMKNDAEGISKGLDTVLQVFNESVKFKSFSEFDAFFMDQNATLKL